jgi:hypothetical protein
MILFINLLNTKIPGYILDPNANNPSKYTLRLSLNQLNLYSIVNNK